MLLYLSFFHSSYLTLARRSIIFFSLALRARLKKIIDLLASIIEDNTIVENTVALLQEPIHIKMIMPFLVLDKDLL